MFKLVKPSRFSQLPQHSQHSKSKPSKSRRNILLTVVVLVLVATYLLWPSKANTVNARLENPSTATVTESEERIVHVVIFQFKDGVADDAISTVCSLFLAVRYVFLTATSRRVVS